MGVVLHSCLKTVSACELQTGLLAWKAQHSLI